MKKYAFNLKTDEDVIIIDSLIDNYPVRLAVDTAATQTVIDLNMLLMIGYFFRGRHILTIDFIREKLWINDIF